MTDEEIVVLVQSGNKDIFKVLVERYERKLFYYIKGLTNQSNEEIEDILQEVFLSAYVNMWGFKTDKKFSSWIYRIAHNKSVDFIKLNKNHKSLDTEEDIYFNKDEKFFEEISIENDQKDKIKKSINLLENKYKEVIFLYYFDEKSYDEISDILRIPVNHVGVLLHRAKNKLKIILKDYER